MALLSQICRVLSDCQHLPNSCDTYSFYHKYFLTLTAIVLYFPNVKRNTLCKNASAKYFPLLKKYPLYEFVHFSETPCRNYYYGFAK